MVPSIPRTARGRHEERTMMRRQHTVCLSVASTPPTLLLLEMRRVDLIKLQLHASSPSFESEPS